MAGVIRREKGNYFFSCNVWYGVVCFVLFLKMIKMVVNFHHQLISLGAGGGGPSPKMTFPPDEKSLEFWRKT